MVFRRLDNERATRLADLPGWSWDPAADDWEEGFRTLLTFVSREGHARVPAKHRESGFALGHLVSYQRLAMKEGRLSAWQIARLESLPKWSWDPRENDWEDGFAQLIAYVRREGNASVPATYSENGFRLGGWVRRQRYARKQGRLTTEHTSRLAAIPGWSWSVSDNH